MNRRKKLRKIDQNFFGKLAGTNQTRPRPWSEKITQNSASNQKIQKSFANASEKEHRSSLERPLLPAISTISSTTFFDISSFDVHNFFTLQDDPRPRLRDPRPRLCGYVRRQLLQCIPLLSTKIFLIATPKHVDYLSPAPANSIDYFSPAPANSIDYFSPAPASASMKVMFFTSVGTSR